MVAVNFYCDRLHATAYIPPPNVLMLSGSKNGRTVPVSPPGSALHLTVVVGHTGLGQGAGAGQAGAGGHVTVGQRGRGQGGHSPASFLHAELSIITGCCLGMLDFRTYLLKSATGGHSVFNMYRDMSGHAWQGGTLDFRTYLLMSGSRHGGQMRRAIPLHPHFPPALLQDEHLGMPARPSVVKPSAEAEAP